MENSRIGYCFNIETGEFLNEEEVYLEIRTGAYPHANNVTFLRPPECKVFEKAVFREGKWSVIPDYRGCPRYRDDGSVDGIIEDLGEVPKIKKDPPAVDVHVKLSWDSEKEDWVQTIEEGYTLEKDGVVRAMSQVEKIRAGIEELPKGFKIVDDKIVLKTLLERYDDGDITKEEYNAEIDSMRQARYRAETDSMGLRVLRGDCTMEEWKAAIEQIKKDLPKMK